MIPEILVLPLAEVVILGALCGLVGVLAHTHTRIFFTESLTHATFPGAIIAVVVTAEVARAVLATHPSQASLSFAVLIGAAVFCIPMMWVMHRISAIPGQSSPAAAGVVLTLAFALGLFLNKWFAPLPLKVDSFLTGSVISVNSVDVLAAGIVLITALIVILTSRHRLAFVAFDPIGARATGVHIPTCTTLVLGLITATVVVEIPAVGTILPIALIAAPAASAALHVSDVNALHSWATILGIASSLIGFTIGVACNLSIGATIAVVAGGMYLVSTTIHRVQRQ